MTHSPSSTARDAPSRYECKYLLPKELLPELRMLIHPFVEPDRHALRWPGYRYPIGSLYLDTPDLFLFRQTENGEKNRFKLRIRAYDDDPASPIFVEVKRRVDGVVRKWRVAVRRSVANRLLLRQSLDGGARDRAPNLGEFLVAASEIHAGPVLRVRYEREAYESRDAEPTRITFDTNLAFNPTTDERLGLGGSGWERTLRGVAILEIKFTERFPSWIQGIVHSLNLQRTSVPKYGISTRRALASGLCTIPVIRHRPVGRVV